LSDSNVHFTSHHLSKLSKDQLFKILGLPNSEQVIRRDSKSLDKGLPKQLLEAARWDDWIDEDEEDIRVIDLGEAFRQGSEPSKLAQPAHLQVPETIFTDNFNYTVDLWRVGILVRPYRLNF
jgi:serine/threonine-protein kinase SRPK3